MYVHCFSRLNAIAHLIDYSVVQTKTFVTRFIVAIWNQTCNISMECLYSSAMTLITNVFALSCTQLTPEEVFFSHNYPFNIPVGLQRTSFASPWFEVISIHISLLT
jgi:hypothetical protein